MDTWMVSEMCPVILRKSALPSHHTASKTAAGIDTGNAILVQAKGRIKREEDLYRGVYSYSGLSARGQHEAIIAWPWERNLVS
jgi:hypothetical protein